MVLFIVVVAIALISMLLSYRSIQNDIKKGRHVEEVKKNLEKERVVFYAPAHKAKHNK